MKELLLVFISMLLLQTGSAQKVSERNFESQFKKQGVDGCFVMFNESANEFIRYNSDLCDTGYIPASTFKIPHSVIALEEQVVMDTSQVIVWNGQEWPNKSWNQHQTLKTAMKYSCVWVYTGFAEHIPIEKYYQYVNGFGYGNKDLTGPPTRFWLAGKFRISANQQIEFLRKFYHHNLPVSARSIDLVKDLLITEETPSYRFSAKSGGGVLSENQYIMWLVGYVEKKGHVFYYAMNFKSNDFDKTKQARYEIVIDILKDLKVID